MLAPCTGPSGTRVDNELAGLIAAQGLEGDPSVYVDVNGRCVRRVLPTVDEPVATLGRALFFTKDLSGDKNVACASCHHPALGGGDALSIAMGPVDDDDAMGADRVRGLNDASQLQVPRNANTTFNIAFWDDGVFWDSRVQSLHPVKGENGASGPIATPDSSSILDSDLFAGENLVVAQARFPVGEEHEMAGSFASLYASRDAIRDALANRLADDATWVARFEAMCTSTSPLPSSWEAACQMPAGPARTAALVTFAHAVYAIGEYERSQVFVESPWKRYVQGDPTALSPGEKKGALLFLKTTAQGGQNCMKCHAGDFFTDERFHAVGSPQIGPGKDAGDDAGRGRVTHAVADHDRFRTPTLLNVEVTAPYFHSGAYGSLRKAVDHYDHQHGRVLEYFGAENKSDTNVRPWCRMTQFKDIPSCAALYSIDHTHAIDVVTGLDPEADNLHPLANDNDVFLVAFLKSLTDPRVRDRAALAPWIDPDSTLRVTSTSVEWDQICDSQIERTADINLHITGFRWMLTGALVDGVDVNTGAQYADAFGVRSWELLEPEFGANSGVPQTAKSLGVALLEVLTAEQRQALYAAYAALETRGNFAAWKAHRLALFDNMNARRNGVVVADSAFSSRMTQMGALEAADLVDITRAYAGVRDLAGAAGTATQAAHQTRLRALKSGDLSSLPSSAFVVDTNGQVTQVKSSPAVRGESGFSVTRNGSLSWDQFAAGYVTWSLGIDCARAFTPRLGDGERRADLFGYPQWEQAVLFDLQTGREGSGGLQENLSNWIGAREADLGLGDLFASTLDDVIAQRAVWDTARGALVAALDDVAAATTPALLTAASTRVQVAQADLAAANGRLLLDHVDYAVALWGAVQTSGDDRLTPYLTCLESATTQAARASNGGSGLGDPLACEPPP